MLKYTCKNDESHVKEEIIPSYLAAHKAPAIGISAASAFVIALAALSVIFRDRLKELIMLILRKTGAEKILAADKKSGDSTEEKVGDSTEEIADVPEEKDDMTEEKADVPEEKDDMTDEKADVPEEKAEEKSGDKELINKE